MKVLIIADDDSFVQALENKPVDLLIACGDLNNDAILQVAQKVNAPRIFAVKGNHDSSAAFPTPILDLHLSPQTFNGLKFCGFNGSWKYKPSGNYLYEQSEVQMMLKYFPAVDIFVAHNSPRRVHDREDSVHIGFEAFTSYIEQKQPRYFIHGHQHLNKETQIGKTTVIGVYGYRFIEIDNAIAVQP